MTAVTKLLIANRGEIACRIARTAQRMGIATVAVHSSTDEQSLHVESADEAVALGGERAVDSYLRIDALIDAATRTGADALHPGYGFLAENAALARACAEAGITFVGPAPAVIESMGDKLRAKEIMAEAGVPVLPSVAVEEERAPEFGHTDVPYPVIVKAAAGGGGKGMRVVHRPEDLAEAVAAARREAASAFSDDRVFVEPFVARPRHVEVQILGDDQGTVLHLGERECSVQRRHQKVIEEAPSPVVDAALRQRLCTAAVEAARALGYTNAGTVEFVLDADARFWFLEVNTRLQVEHPVTELAWERADGRPLDLVELQIDIARGHPLPFAQDGVRLARHAVEARLYAEDPAAGYLPATGRLAVWAPADDGVRWDVGVRQGDEVSIHYDPLLAKVIAAAPTRSGALDRLARSLDRSRVHGVTTNRDLLVTALRHEAYRAGDLHTGFLDEHLPEGPPATPQAVHERHAVAAALGGARSRNRAARVLRTVPPGWRNNGSTPQRTSYRVGEDMIHVAYRLRRDGTWEVTVDDRAVDVRVAGWPDTRPDGLLDLAVDGLRARCHVHHAAARVFVDSAWGSSDLAEIARFPDEAADAEAGGLVAPMPGTVVSVHADAGQRVRAGDLLVVLEAMKMEHRITAPHDGTVERVGAAPGRQVAAGDVLAVLMGADGTAEP